MEEYENHEEQDLVFKVACREHIERFGGIDRAKELILEHPNRDDLLEQPEHEPITARQLEEYMYGYLLCGLDNPFGITLESLKNGYAELKKIVDGFGVNGELCEVLKFSRATLGYEHKDGREYSYDIDDFLHMIKNAEKSCNTRD